jgi:hypothetical protein
MLRINRERVSQLCKQKQKHNKTKIAIDIVGTSSDDQYKTIDIPSYEIVVIIIICTLFGFSSVKTTTCLHRNKENIQ